MIAMIEQDRQIVDVIARELPRLRSFIRRRVANDGDADDLLQDVFLELVEAYRLRAVRDRSALGPSSGKRQLPKTRAISGLAVAVWRAGGNGKRKQGTSLVAMA